MFAVKVNGALKKAYTLKKTQTEVFTFAETVLSCFFIFYQFSCGLSIQIE